MQNELIEITNNTILKLKQFSIITPELYVQIFNVEKSKYFNEEVVLPPLENIIGENMKLMETFSQKIESNTKKVEENTEQAIQAIQIKDESTLNKILKDMQTIQKEFLDLRKELYTDPLTKINNRRYLYEKEIKDEKFIDNGIFVFCDLNDFKIINDTQGHIIGDKVLTYFTSFVSKKLDDKKIKYRFIRYAGDEFIIMIDSKNLSECCIIVQEINEQLKKQLLKANKKDATFTISFSFGIVPYTKEDTLVDIIELSDKKMYVYKKMTKEKK